ncbi:hypothetical protein FHG87_024831 [Trinorchestia longiramus]|nr:hypothetical protein FHG87_024831 [Trinorchestia longiramus]
MPKKRQRRGTSSLSSSGGDSDGWISIDSSTECIPPTPSQPLSPCQVMISDGLCPQIGDTWELLCDQQLSLTPIPAIEINPDKNLNPEVHSFEGFLLEQGDVITPVQQNSRKMPQNNNPTNPTIILVEPSMEDEAKNKKILANDVVLSKALANSAFGTAGISNIKKNLVVHTTAGNVPPQAHAHVAIAVVTTLQTMEVVLRSGKLEKWRKLDKFKHSPIGMLQGSESEQELQMMLEIVNGYSTDFKVKFGGDKSKVMVINGDETDRDSGI